jgi:hypothetical protein
VLDEQRGVDEGGTGIVESAARATSVLGSACDGFPSAHNKGAGPIRTRPQSVLT